MRLEASATQTPVWRLPGKWKTSWLPNEMKALMKTARSWFGILTVTVVLAMQANAGYFINTGSMTTARYWQTATLLPNGQVLVAGGSGSGNYNFLSSAELYDPTNGMWTATQPMTSIRFCHTATLLLNGKVLVAGGYRNSVYLSSAELYDPATGAWTPTNSMTNARNGHTTTLLQNGIVLVAGGNNGPSFLSGAELFDPATGEWTPTGSMTSVHQSHTATLLPNGKVLVAGGYDGSSYLSNAELYDPATGEWTRTGSMTNARAEFAATLLPNGKVLVAGGSTSGWLSSAELFDPATGRWTPAGSMANARNAYTMTLLPNGQVLVEGGMQNEASGKELSSAELFDPATGTWTQSSPMTNGRKHHTATLLPNGKVLIAGAQVGMGPSSIASSSAELYVPEPRVDLIKAVKPSISCLSPGTNYQLQVSADMTAWTNQGVAIHGYQHQHGLSAVLGCGQLGQPVLPVTGSSVAEKCDSDSKLHRQDRWRFLFQPFCFTAEMVPLPQPAGLPEGSRRSPGVWGRRPPGWRSYGMSTPGGVAEANSQRPVTPR